MATYTPGSASDLDSLDSIKKVQEYLIKQERKLDYMFNNLSPEDNYSEQARLIMVEDGERQASIEVSLNQIALNYVSKSGVVSAINLSEEMIQIEASKIKLEGMVTVNGYFKVGLDGSIEAKNGKFSGDISASNITGSHIYASYYGVKDQDDFYIVDMGDYTEIGFAGFEGWGDKIFRSYTMGTWTNPASNDSSRIALNSNNGVAGFTTLYLEGLGDLDVANAIRSTVSGSDDEHDGSDGTEPDPNPQDPPEDPDVMHFDHIEVRNDLPAEPQALRTALRSTPTPITKTYDMLVLNGVKGWIRDSWSRRKIEALQTDKQDALSQTQLDAVNSGVTAAFITGKFATVTGTFASTNSTWSSYEAFPTGFNNTNCVMLSYEARGASGDWRMGEGAYATAYARSFASMDTNGIRAYTTTSGLVGKDFRVTLMRTDI